MNYKDLIYSLSCLTFITVIGGAVYEHLAVVPRWSAAPPVSLTMFQGEYGLNAGAFWTVIHPITLITIVAALFVSWKTPRKRNVVMTTAGYFIVLITTAIYFVPELLEIIGTPPSDTVDAPLTKRAEMWETLSLVRLAFMLGLSIVLLGGLTKSVNRR